MIHLSDKGKLRLGKLASWPSLFHFLLVLLCSIASYFSFYWSSSAAKDRVAASIATAADESDTKSLNLLFTSNEIEKRSDYINFFQIGFNIYNSNLNRDKFDSYTVYSPGANLFGQSFSYRCSDIYPDGEELAIFPSPFNSIVGSAEEGYRHEIWGIHFLFEKSVLNSTNGTTSTNFCYIPISSADYLLCRQGIESPSSDDYSSLLGRTIEVVFLDKTTGAEQKLNWCIGNIYQEDEQYVFFTSRFGHPLFCYLALPSFAYPSLSIDFGHSQFMCKEYLTDYFDEQFLPRSCSSVSVAPRIDGKTSVTSQNINSILEGFQDGYSALICLGVFILILLLFSICLGSLVFVRHFYVTGFVLTSCGAYVLCFLAVLCLSELTGSIIPFYSSILSIVSAAWCFVFSCSVLACKRRQSRAMKRLENDRLSI